MSPSVHRSDTNMLMPAPAACAPPTPVTCVLPAPAPASAPSPALASSNVSTWTAPTKRANTVRGAYVSVDLPSLPSSSAPPPPPP
eukprot:CAMPEP_0181358278 /NCGR_PEP_ID=MMETSP1106-20121128/5425_1 /TAXON_ID=81844 /ORGANISM="Mantoniella antarctica, Strain SL-175" /LENGTH=84 /DNA_ID=CAMNT_0023471229 /DNA_START=842 /DNA_END=1093 /DNA_ORIENTATION=-